MGQHATEHNSIFARIARRFRRRISRRPKYRSEKIIIHEISPADSHFDFPWNQPGHAEQQDQIANSIKSLFDRDAALAADKNISAARSVNAEREYDFGQQRKFHDNEQCQLSGNRGRDAVTDIDGDPYPQSLQRRETAPRENQSSTIQPPECKDSNISGHTHGNPRWLNGEWQPEGDTWDYTTVVKDPITMEQIYPHVHTTFTVHRTRSIHFHEHRFAIQPVIDTSSS